MYTRAFLYIAAVLSLLTTGFVAQPADACVNAARVKQNEAVKKVSEAERALAAGDHAQVRKILDEDGRFDREGALRWTASSDVILRAHRILAISYVRSEPKRAKDFEPLLADARRDRPDDVVAKARLAEALAALGTRDEKEPNLPEIAKSMLEELAKKDLIAEPEAWATLAKLRRTAGDAKGADEAGARCAKMTKRKGVCPVTSGS